MRATETRCMEASRDKARTCVGQVGYGPIRLGAHFFIIGIHLRMLWIIKHVSVVFLVITLPRPIKISLSLG